MCPMFQVFSRESLFTWIFKRSNHVRYNLERETVVDWRGVQRWFSFPICVLLLTPIHTKSFLLPVLLSGHHQ